MSMLFHPLKMRCHQMHAPIFLKPGHYYVGNMPVYPEKYLVLLPRRPPIRRWSPLRWV